jgi:hypothetical protein
MTRHLQNAKNEGLQSGRPKYIVTILFGRRVNGGRWNRICGSPPPQEHFTLWQLKFV